MPPQKKKRLQSIVAGFVGGLAPFLVNLAQALVGNSQLKTHISIGYFIGLLIFGLIGAFMPFILGELNLAKAFFLGVSAPAMISLATKDANASSVASQTTPLQASFGIIGSAYAQATPPALPSTQEHLVKIELNGTMPEATVAFVDATGTELRATTIKLHQNEWLSVPRAATSILVRSGDTVTNRYPLTANADYPQYVQVTGTEGRKKLDLLSAFTGQARILYDIKIAGPPTYLQIADESQRELAWQIQTFLASRGFVTPGVQNVSSKGFVPDTVEVRYLRPADKDEAETVLAILKTQFHITNCRTSYTQRGPSGQPGQIEIWFSNVIKSDNA